MNFDLFDIEPTCAPSTIHSFNDKTLYDWQSKLNEIQQESMQSGFDFLTETADITTYSSGASMKSDILGYIQANAKIGVSMTDTSGPVRAIIADYATQGGKIMLDSGAFRLFRSNLKKNQNKVLDYEWILKRYFEICENTTHPENLLIVALDIVGNQPASFELLKRYQTDIVRLNKLGANIIIPYQGGAVSLENYHQQVMALFSSMEFIVGFPSNAESLPSDKIFRFMERTQPKSVHFLGCSESAIAHEASNYSPLSKITCDATKLRKYVGTGELLTEMQRSITEDVIQLALHGIESEWLTDTPQWDETEILGDIHGFLHSLSNSKLALVCDTFHVNLYHIQSLEDDDAIWQAFNEGYGGYAEQVLLSLLPQMVGKECSPKVRRNVVSHLSKIILI